MIFPQDQLGDLVRQHITEQTRRFDTSEEQLRARREALQEAERLSKSEVASPPASAYPPRYPHSISSSRESSTQSIALHAVQQGGLSRSSSTAAAPRTNGVAHAEHRNVSPVRRESEMLFVAPPLPADHPMASNSALFDAAGDASAFAQHRALSFAVENSPMMLGLQHTILRLEEHMTKLYERQTSTDDRVRRLEDETSTLRLELQSVCDLCMRHTSTIAELRQALLHTSASANTARPVQIQESSSTVLPMDDEHHHKQRALQETQALLATVLQEDQSTAAALIGVRPGFAGDAGGNAKETVCDQCFQKARCTSCGNCGSEWYCSANCALLRRDKHRAACDMLRSMRRTEMGGK
jgi:hypothetical protein